MELSHIASSLSFTIMPYKQGRDDPPAPTKPLTSTNISNYQEILLKDNLCTENAHWER